MQKSTFHAHSRFDDGQLDLEDYVRSALDRNFTVLGFSAHAPVYFETEWNMKPELMDEYVALAGSLKDKYRDRIQIYTGLEADFYAGCADWRNLPGIDYTIGAIHFMQNPDSGRYLAFDGNRREFEENLEENFNGDAKLLVKGYYGLVREMLLKMPPNILAHLDVIRKNNAGGRYFDEDEEWYREEVMKTLDVIALTRTILEVNTGGISRGYVTEPYPSRWILENCLALDIPVMVNSDTHHPDTIDFYFDETYELLRDIGFKSQRILYDGEWRDVGLGKKTSGRRLRP
jgi:histidinol-phosphatase (PHP family)